MARGDVYSDQEVTDELNRSLPRINEGREQKIDFATAKALLMTENMDKQGNAVFRNARSPVGAVGVGQVMPATMEGLKRKGYLPADHNADLNNASLGVQVATSLAAMSEMADTIGSTEPRYLAAYYNGGTGARKAFASGRMDQLPAETADYLTKFDRALSQLNGGNYVPPVANSSNKNIVSVAFRSSPLQEAERMYNDMQAQIPSLLEAIGLGNDKSQAASIAGQAAVIAGGRAAGEIARQQAEVTIANDAKANSIIRALGMDVTDPESAISTLLVQRGQSEAARVNARKEIIDLQSISFLENPLGYLMAIPELQSKIPQYNSTVDVENEITSKVGNLLGIAAAAKQLMPGNTSDILRAKASAEADVVLAQANERVAAARMQSAAGDAKTFLDRHLIARNSFADTLQLEGIQQSLALRMERADSEKERKAIKDGEGKKNELLAAGINKIRAMLGNKDADPVTADAVGRMSPAQLGPWQEVLNRGNLGNTYAQSVPFIENFGNKAAAASGGNAMMMELVRGLELQAKADATELLNKAKMSGAPMKYDNALQGAYEELFTRHSAVARKGALKDNVAAGASPYAIDYETIFETSIRNKVVGNSVIEALQIFKEAAPNKSLNGQVTDRNIIDGITAKVVSGQLSPTKAATEISIFYSGMSAQGYGNKGLAYLGLPPLQDYQITMSDPAKSKVDLMNPTKIEHYLTGRVATKKARAAIQAEDVNTFQIPNVFGGAAQ